MQAGASSVQSCGKALWDDPGGCPNRHRSTHSRNSEMPAAAQGSPRWSTHQSSSTTRTSTKKVFLLTRFLNVSAKGENFSYVGHGLRKQPSYMGRNRAWERAGCLLPAAIC